MANAIRASWKANRHWLAAGFLLATILFLLFMYFSVHDSFRGIAESRQTALGTIANSPASLFIPGLRHAALQEMSETPRARAYLESAPAASPSVIGGVVGGVPGGVIGGRVGSVKEQVSIPEHMVVRTGGLKIISDDPARAADQVRALAERLGGFVVSSTVSGDRDSRAAQMTVRIPAAQFDAVREQVRRMAKKVEQDSTQAQDVTREAVEQDATLRNARAEEQQYLALLRRSGSLKDVLAVSEQLADVRGRIERQEADLSYLRHQVEMSLLAVEIHAVPVERAPGVSWKPVVAARAALVDALDSLGDFADSVVALLLYLPVIAAWVLLLFAILKVGWWTLVRLARAFFPGLPWWKRNAPVQAG